MLKKLYAQPNLPENVRVVRSRAFSAAHLHASRVYGAARWESMRHFLLFILYYPPNFLTETGNIFRRATNWLAKRTAKMGRAEQR
jgi:hypothetical protein